MMLKLFFHLLSIMVGIYMIKEDDYLSIIIAFAIFSLFSSVIYFLDFAPDVAIAEIAISSAIIPLIFIVAVSKQREYIVVGDVFSEGELSNKEYIVNILEEFTNQYGLKLHIISNSEDLEIGGVFRTANVDLYVKTLEIGDKYFFIGKESNIVMINMEKQLAANDNINVILMPNIEQLRMD